MIVCIDIGNTATKLTAVADEVARARVALPTGEVGEADHLFRLLEALILDAGEEPARFAIASVVTEVTDGVADAITGRWSSPVLTVDHRCNLGFTLAVTMPELVGPDRLCAAAGAVDGERRDAVIVDIGSAITVDRVRDGAFVGGAIMPGPALMFDGLASHTSRLPAIDVGSLQTLFPRLPQPTKHAMTLGVGAALLGGIKEAVARLGGSDRDVPVVVTGGLVSLVSDELPTGWTQEPDLVACGLYRIAALNASS